MESEMNELQLINFMFEGLFPVPTVAKALGLSSKDMENTTLENVKFSKVHLVRVPLSVFKFTNNESYVVATLKKGESEDKYDYVLTISPTLKVGFWK